MKYSQQKKCPPDPPFWFTVPSHVSIWRTPPSMDYVILEWPHNPFIWPYCNKFCKTCFNLAFQNMSRNPYAQFPPIGIYSPPMRKGLDKTLNTWPSFLTDGNLVTMTTKFFWRFFKKGTYEALIKKTLLEDLAFILKSFCAKDGICSSKTVGGDRFLVSKN